MSIEKMKYRAVIFDLDGTLMDTIADLTDSVNHAMRCNGLAEHSLLQVRSFVGNGLHKLIERAVPVGTSNDTLQKCYSDMTAYYKAHSMVKSRPYPGVQDLLMELRARGINTAIVTNKIQSSAEDIALKFFPTVNVVVGDNGYRHLKPAPDGALIAMQKLGCLPAQTVFIGDSEVDMQTAQNAGVEAIAVLWGFRDRDCLLRFGAKRFASNCEDLRRYLIGGE